MEPKQIYLGKEVRLGQNCVLTGRVTMGDGSSAWHNVVIRGDVEPVTIGKRCNIQDNSVIHGQLGKHSVTIGDDVSIGHGCILHGCELADHSFIGMGAIVMNGAYIGNHVLVGAGSLVPEGKRFDEPYSLVLGRPAKVLRKLNEKEIAMIEGTPKRYLDYAQKWLPPSAENDGKG